MENRVIEWLKTNPALMQLMDAFRYWVAYEYLEEKGIGLTPQARKNYLHRQSLFITHAQPMGFTYDEIEEAKVLILEGKDDDYLLELVVGSPS